MTTSRPATGAVVPSWSTTTPRGSTATVVVPCVPRSTPSYCASNPSRPTVSSAVTAPSPEATSDALARST